MGDINRSCKLFCNSGNGAAGAWHFMSGFVIESVVLLELGARWLELHIRVQRRSSSGYSISAYSQMDGATSR